MKALIFDLQRISYVDGPGIRTTVFFKGCNLRCKWCHNPESQSFSRELLFYKDRCVCCGSCEAICPNKLESCDACGSCTEHCRRGAREICGKEMSPKDVLSEVIKDRIFFESSGGGVTFSGGECMLQSDFLAEILKLCRKERIHTAVDTAGNVPWDSFLKILNCTDLFLYDIKSMDTHIHKKYTGVGNELILENLARLLETGARIWVRVPIVAGVNDSICEMEAIKKFYKKHAFPEKTELLEYHALGKNKYCALNREQEPFSPPSKKTLEALRAVFASP